MSGAGVAVEGLIDATASALVPRRPFPGAHPALPTWKPGQSGNPGGRSRRYAEVMQLAQERSLQAIEKLAVLMNCGDERVELMAATAVLDRAFGKPKEQKADDNQGIRPDLSALTPEDLAALRRVAAKLAATQLIEQAAPLAESNG